MPTMYDCLQAAMDAGEVDPGYAREAQSRYRDLAEMYARDMPRGAAEAKAAADIKTATREAVEARRHLVLNQLKAMRHNEARFARADPHELVREVETTRYVRDAYMRQFTATIGAFLKKTSRNLAGNVRNQALVRDVVRELHGETSGSAAAKLMAQAITKAFERARTLFNAHGGNIRKLADFGLPHQHDWKRIKLAGFETWRKQVFDRLAWHRIIDTSTGKAFTADVGGIPNRAAAGRFLREVYDNISTAGWASREPSFAPGGKALYDQRAEHRILHFNGADDWLAYNDLFGTSNPFDAMLNHLNGMARDIALMRSFGPNPTAGLTHAAQVVEKASRAVEGKAGLRAVNRAGRKIAKAKAMLKHMTGEANVPGDHAWAAFFAGTRKLLTAAQLGAAPLSAVTDMMTQMLAAGAVGMGARGPLVRAIGLMSSSATRETAAAMGYVADTLSHAGSASARMLGDTWSPEITDRISNFALRINGLSFWTDMNRIAFQMEFSAHLAQNIGKHFDRIDPRLRATLAERGFTAADWDALRAGGALFTAPNGSKFLSPWYWLENSTLPRAEADGLSIRLQTVIEEQMEFAVPSVSLEGRVSILGDAAPGTILGEAARSGAMYKNYSLSLMLNQIRRIQAQSGGWSCAAYAAKLMAGMTAMGALAVQLKEIAKGRDPRPMNTWSFLGAAATQGGGLGIFGDFFSASTSRAGGGFAETALGPVGGLIGDVSRAVASNTARAAAGKPTLIGRDVGNFFRRYTPLTTTFYARTGFDRIVWDNLQRLMDPDAEDQWRRASQNLKSRHGQRLWWLRGRTSPDRGPDFSNILGGQQ